MARQTSRGFELGTGATIEPNSTGSLSGTGAASFQSAIVRSGALAGKSDSGASGGTASWSLGGIASGPSETLFLRVFMRFENLPGSTVRIFGDDSGTVWSAQLTATGAVQLWTTAQQGSDSAELIVAGDGKWHRLEASLLKNVSAQITNVELRLNGVTVATVSGLTAALPTMRSGWIDNPGTSKVCYMDDYAVNDSSGANQNTWVGDTKIVLLMPTSDNARAGFAGGAGGTTNLFDAVNNVPPVGVADTGTNASQIRDPVSSTTDNYDANVTTYTAAGIAAADTVNLLQWVINHGAASATSPPTRAGRLVSNPAEGADTTLTTPSTAAGTYPTNWTWDRGPVSYAPSVTKGTSPVLRIGKRTASTRVVDVDFMGIYVDYTPAVPKSPPFASRTQRNFLLRR